MTPQSQPRRWVRQSVDLPVKIGIYSDSGAVLVPGRVTELSEGGMSLYAGMALKPGDLLEVEFELPMPQTVQAVVRNRTGYNFGVEFVETLRG
jgi:PilZ domain